ncbi:MAG: hypothetical protein ACRD11_16550 [Terriglobia bacterium]
MTRPPRLRDPGKRQRNEDQRDDDHDDQQADGPRRFVIVLGHRRPQRST